MADSPADDNMRTSAERRKAGRPKMARTQPSAPAPVVPFLDAAAVDEAPVLSAAAPAAEIPHAEVATAALAAAEVLPEFKVDVEIEAAPETDADLEVQAVSLPESLEAPALDTTPAISAPAEIVPVPSNVVVEIPAAAQPKGSFFMATIAPEMTKPATERFQAMFGDVNARAKTAFEKSTKLAEELSELTKGNVEAFVASGRVVAKGAEALTQEATEYSKKSFETATGAMRSFAAAKSPVELIQLQNDFAKTSFDAAIAEASKLSETWVKLATDVCQPLSSRFAVAAEKIKAATL